MNHSSFTIANILASAPIDTIEAELLFSFILRKPREFVLAHPEYPLTENEKLKIESTFKRRKEGEPLAYIVGHKEFFGREFFVTPDTLIPRPETEILVEAILKQFVSASESDKVLGDGDFPKDLAASSNSLRRKKYILDIGTGSGCIITTLTLEMQKMFPKNSFHFFGIDSSERALRIAKKNAKEICKEKKITFLKSHLLDFFLSSEFSVTSSLSLVVIANLPYVPSAYLNKKETESTKGLSFEPRSALDGGPDGFDAYRTLLKQLGILREKMPSAPIDCFFEIGSDQKNIAEREIRKHFPDTRTSMLRDLSGHPRIVSFSLTPRSGQTHPSHSVRSNKNRDKK